jgi:hypothetical protein
MASLEKSGLFHCSFETFICGFISPFRFIDGFTVSFLTLRLAFGAFHLAYYFLALSAFSDFSLLVYRFLTASLRTRGTHSKN